MAMPKQTNACEKCCYRRILQISWMDRVKDVEVFERMQTNLHFMEDMMKRKFKYAGHVLRGSSGLPHLQILEGQVEGKRKVDGPRRTWMKDMGGWTRIK
jgi:hypothetical protein